MSASSSAFFAFKMPIFSIVSAALWIPAVSNKCNTMPSKFTCPSTISRVVPAISVTIAFSSPIKAFNNEDLPTLGFPTIAVLIPSLIMIAFLPSLINSLILYYNQ